MITAELVTSLMRNRLGDDAAPLLEYAEVICRIAAQINRQAHEAGLAMLMDEEASVAHATGMVRDMLHLNIGLSITGPAPKEVIVRPANPNDN